jgi:hypothetical protein
MLITIVLLGMIVGSAVGAALEHVLPDGVVKRFLVESVGWGLQPRTLDLVVVTLTFGFRVSVNVMGVLGVVLAVYLFRWY